MKAPLDTGVKRCISYTLLTTCGWYKNQTGITFKKIRDMERFKALSFEEATESTQAIFKKHQEQGGYDP